MKKLGVLGEDCELSGTHAVSWESLAAEEQGQIRHQPAHLIDVMATCMDLAELQAAATQLSEDLGRSENQGIDVKVIDGLGKASVGKEHQ